MLSLKICLGKSCAKISFNLKEKFDYEICVPLRDDVCFGNETNILKKTVLLLLELPSMPLPYSTLIMATSLASLPLWLVETLHVFSWRAGGGGGGGEEPILTTKRRSFFRCNCDGGEMMWTFDDGELTDRSQLPVIKLNFGNFYEVHPQGADPDPPSSTRGKAGRNHLNGEITPLLPTGKAERYSQTVSNLSNLGHAAAPHISESA